MAKGFLGLNPTAVGILVGGLVGGPGGAAVGAGIGAMYDHSKGQQRNAKTAYENQVKAGVQNKNALVEANYNKKVAARGLGEGTAPAASPLGNQASQTGAVLTTPTGDAKNNILG